MGGKIADSNTPGADERLETKMAQIHAGLQPVSQEGFLLS